MQTSTIVVLACLVAVVVAAQAQPVEPVVDTLQESLYDTPAHDNAPRNKRGLLLLKKKLILGALGLKAAKVAAGGAVVGALAYKSKQKSAHGHHSHHTYYHHGLPAYSIYIPSYKLPPGRVPLVVKY